MSYTPKSKLSYPLQIYSDSNYGSTYRTNYGGSYSGSSTVNNKAMSQQLEKCWNELVCI